MGHCGIHSYQFNDIQSTSSPNFLLYWANLFSPSQPLSHANVYARFVILSLFSNLQEGVPDTIANLRLAGMIVWVLTGDKQETAINIAHSCKLFTEKMEIIKLNAHSRDSAEQILNKNLEEIKHFNENIDESQHNESDNQGKKVICTKNTASLTVHPVTSFEISKPKVIRTFLVESKFLISKDGCEKQMYETFIAM